jgi:outer membrane protein
MKYISTVLSIVALGLVGVVFFSQKRQIEDLKRPANTEKSPVGSGFKIAYFVMDSLMANYDEFKEAQTKVKAKENEMTQELTNLDRKNQATIDGWRQKQATMTQAEGEQAQMKYQEMMQYSGRRKQELEQGVYKLSEELKTNIRKSIEEFLNTYNKQKNYTYIIQYDANSIIYTKDSTYDITTDLVAGLNGAYSQSKKVKK